MGPDGRLWCVRGLSSVDSAFVERAVASGKREARLRSAEPPRENECRDWDGGCRVAAGASSIRRQSEAEGGLPECGIRHACRSFAPESRQSESCTHLLSFAAHQSTDRAPVTQAIGRPLSRGRSPHVGDS
jgi:hypothetical protein